MGYEIGKLTRLPLGYVGESGTRTIKVDMTAWLAAFVGAVIVVQVVRPDKYPYFAATTLENGILSWVIQKEDVSVPGKGWAQIEAVNPETGDSYKSRVVQTEVYRSLEDFTGAQPGDPAKGWVQEVLDARDEAVEAADRAEAAAGSGSGTGGSSNVVAVPSYWLNHLKARSADAVEAMAAAGWNRSAFLWYHDAHWSYNYKNSPALLKYLYQHTPINKTFFGGDIVDAEGDTPEDMAYLWEWRHAIRDLPNHHSVAGNHDDGNSTDNRWDDAYIYNYLLASEETLDVVHPHEGMYYYIDSAAEKTRYLFLDTATYDGNFKYNSKQQAWLKASLLSTPAGWHIVAISHIWVKVDYSVWPPVVTGLDSSGKAALDVFDAYNARTGDYAACTGKVEFVIGGHSHVDADYKSDGGIPVVLTETDSRGVRSGLECKKGTISEQSVNAVIADYTHGIITIVRVGRGNSRIVKLDGSGSEILPNEPETPETPDTPGGTGEDYDLIAPTGDFTNQIKLASDGSGAVYNSPYGYKNNTRYSVTNGENIDAEGWDQTGFIPVKAGDVIRFKNILFYEPVPTATHARCSITAFDSDFNYINQVTGITIDNPLSEDMKDIYHDENGQLKQFTMTNNWGSNVAYMLVCAYNITGASIITVNEVINIADEVEEDYTMVAPTGNFTNQIKISTGDDGKVYNTYGYRNNTRISVSSLPASERDENGWDLTGYIPVSPGDTVRFKNILFYEPVPTAAHARCAIIAFNANKEFIALQTGKTVDNPLSDTMKNIVHDENGQLVQFDMTTHWASQGFDGPGYMRICAHNITGASVITVNEEIVITGQ